MIDWKPIEQAPKDGSKIIVFTETGDVEQVYWDGRHWTSRGFWIPCPTHFSIINAPEGK